MYIDLYIYIYIVVSMSLFYIKIHLTDTYESVDIGDFFLGI
jgi:hypothetical protein